MNTVRAIAVPVLLLAAGAALAACGAGDGPPAPGRDLGEQSADPTSRNLGDERAAEKPTDVVSNDGSVVGTVTRGGPGPCYGLVTDDGTEYALHNADGPALTQGTRVRVHVGPPSHGTDCGEGRPMQLRYAEPL